MLGEDVFVGGVCSFADGTHAVQGGDVEGCGEVSVGASAGGGFVELEAELGGESAGLFVKGDGAGFTLHGRAVDASGDGEFAGGVGGSEAAEEAVDVSGVGGAGDTDVDFGVGFCGDYVGACAALEDADVDGELAGGVGEIGDGFDEAGELANGGVAAGEVDAAMGAYASDVELVVADTFAGGLVGEALGGFEDEDGGGGEGEALGDGAGDGAADLFFGVEKEGNGAVDSIGLKCADGGEGHEDAGFHVEDAGAVQGVGGFVPRHGGEGSEGPNGVEMAEEKVGFAGRFLRTKAEFVDVAVEFLAVDFDAATDREGERGGEFHSGVDGVGVFAGGLDLHEIAEVGAEPGEFCFDGLREPEDVHGRRL